MQGIHSLERIFRCFSHICNLFIFYIDFQTWTEALGVKFPVKKLVSSSTPCTWVSLLLFHLFCSFDAEVAEVQDHVMGSQFDFASDGCYKKKWHLTVPGRPSLTMQKSWPGILFRRLSHPSIHLPAFSLGHFGHLSHGDIWCVMVMYVVDHENLARWSLPSKQVGRVGEDTQLRQTSRPSQRESERTFYRQSKWKGKTKTNIVKGQRQGKEGLKRYFIEKDKEKTKKRTKTRKTSRPLQRESEKVYTDQVKAKN